LATVSEDAGGAPRTHRDALVLLAAFMQHTDNKPSQQRLVCRGAPDGDDGAESKATGAGERCATPFLMINDAGLTFGRANYLNSNARGSMNLDAWSKVPVWKNPERCVANLARSYSGTLSDPQVTEAGRQFLADLLMQLTDKQIRDLFTVSRVQLRTRIPDQARSGLATVDEWVAAFNAKRAQLVTQTCGQPVTTSARH
jgi:hypothetical protein